MRHRSGIGRGSVVAVITAAALAIGSSQALADEPEAVTKSDVAQAINTTEGVNGGLIQEPAPARTDVDSAAVTNGANSSVDIPRDPEVGVSIDSPNQEPVSVNLPNADEASNATRLSDGTVVYPGTDGSAQAVIPTEAGVQMLTTITNASAPTRYDYDVEVPAGGKIEIVNGSAKVVAADGTELLTVPTPWAKDADGTAVPIHFETDGNTLTQVVAHNSNTFTYPVVADPVWFAWSFVVAFTFVWQKAARGCGVGFLADAGYQSLVYGWVWREVVRAGRDGCVIGALGGFRGFVRRW